MTAGHKHTSDHTQRQKNGQQMEVVAATSQRCAQGATATTIRCNPTGGGSEVVLPPTGSEVIPWPTEEEVRSWEV